MTVDCSRGQKIANALRQGDFRKPLVVVVRGTCNEHVSISRDDVTLRGRPGSGATVNGPDSGTDTIVILKDTVNIEDLTVTGGLNGIRLQGPFYAGVKNVLVRNTASNGIIVRAGDLAVENGTVEHAGGSGMVLARGASARIFGNSHFRHSHFTGIYAQDNSTFIVNGGTVNDNEGHGINVDYGSHGTINNVEVFNNATGIMVSASHAIVGGGNNIHDNRAYGVVAQAGAVLGVNGTTVRHNGQVGVLGYLGTTVVMSGNEITDNGESGVVCLNDCTLQISGGRMTGNAHHGISVQRGSTLILLEPETDASGNNWVDLWCGDKESSVDLGANFIGTVDPACTGFDD
ncbi:MAG: right-handed parallel beta-helix repeat-containing protein [Steroidobacteraceae bacterium]|nr:right-handed parallel beta-helix repeat-containing protein [Steroidobacteraceae bacterium]